MNNRPKGPPKDEEAHRRWSSRRRFPELRAHASKESNDDNFGEEKERSVSTSLPTGVVAVPKPKKFISRSGVPQPTVGASPASTTASSYHVSNPAYLTDRLSPSLHGRKRTVYMPSPQGYSATIPPAASASSSSLMGAPYPFGPPVYVPPPLTAASTSSSMPDTVRAPVPYFSFAPGSGIVRSFADGGQSLLPHEQSPTNYNNNNGDMKSDEKREDATQYTGWTGRTFDPRSPMSNYRAALLSRNNPSGGTSTGNMQDGSNTARSTIRPHPPSRRSADGSQSARTLPPFVTRTQSSAKELISSHSTLAPYTEANPFDAPHQVQLRWERENKEKMLAGPFKAPTPSTARDSIAVDYYMNSADEYVKRAERMLVRSRARANMATFKRQLLQSQIEERQLKNNQFTPSHTNITSDDSVNIAVTPPPVQTGYAAAIAAVHAAEAI